MIGRTNVGGSGNVFPQYTYSGASRIEQISDGIKIFFTTSGTLRFSRTGSGVWDLFLVGGGGGASHGTSNAGGGGGGGYTLTTVVNPIRNTDYLIEIGSGGDRRTVDESPCAGLDGGATSAFGYTASGGKGGTLNSSNTCYGGNGGSGGGSRGITNTLPGVGGSDGTDGGKGSLSNGGTGQHTTTKEFAEQTGTLYAGGGAGGSSNTNTVVNGGDGGGGHSGSGNTYAGDGTPNTGGGGGGNCATSTGRAYSGAGGSGIAILRYRETI